jgi:hypothetical protein
MNRLALMNHPPFGPFGFAQGPEPVEGLAFSGLCSGLALSPSASLGMKHRVETVRLSSRPKPA